MNIVKKIKNILGKKQRGFEVAKVSNLLNDWLTSSLSPNEELKGNLKRLRARSRDMAINNDYAKRYLNMVTTNVVGLFGIKLQVKAWDTNCKLDSEVNRTVEEAWMEWSKRENESVTGQLSFVDIQRLVIETTARDGECASRFLGLSNKRRCCGKT
jgi:capsid protein